MVDEDDDSEVEVSSDNLEPASTRPSKFAMIEDSDSSSSSDEEDLTSKLSRKLDTQQLTSKLPQVSSKSRDSNGGTKQVRKMPDPKAVKVKNLKTKTVGLKSKKVSNKKTSKKASVKNESGVINGNKMAANSGTEKSYEDFSPILDGYADLLNHLNPDDPNSEVDKVVKFILDKNIPVRRISVILAHISNTASKQYFGSLESFPLVKTGRFTDGDFGEIGSIRRRWQELVEKVPIINPLKCIDAFSEIRRTSGRIECKKRNVLGCYLGQDLKNVRHACDTFVQACRALREFTTGRFSREEDLIILAEVEKCGKSRDTWKKLAYLLSRKHSNIILHRFEVLSRERRTTRCTWSLEDEEVVLRALFSGKKGGDSVEMIKSFTPGSMVTAAKELDREKALVWRHWLGFLKPILLSYHFGTLHKSWKDVFFDYIIKKRVLANQDLDYKELSELLPEQNSNSLHHAVISICGSMCFKKIPLFQVIQDKLPAYKGRHDTERVRNSREEIVRLYEKVKNRT